MTVRELTSRVWYAQKVVIIAWQQFEKCKDLDEILRKAVLKCENWQLLSETNKEVGSKIVDSYGVMDNYLIIEVH